VGTDYVLEKLPDVSGPGLMEAGRYRMVSEPTLAVSRARVSQLHRHGVHGWYINKLQLFFWKPISKEL